MPDVRLPDGTIVKNVPEGTTKSQLMDKLGRDFSDPVEPSSFDRSKFPPGTVFADPSTLPPGMVASRRSDGPLKFGGGDFLDALRGVGEAGIDLVGKGLGGLAGGVASLPLIGDERAGQVLESVSSGVSEPFSPRTREGQLASEAISLPFQLAEVGADRIGEASPGGAGVQTAVKTALLGIPGLLSPTKGAATNLRSGSFGVLERKPPTLQQRILKEAQAEGYVVPPSSANQSVALNTLESATLRPRLSQEAAFKNQNVTNNLAAREVGIPEGVPVTREALSSIRAKAGEAYAVLENAGTIVPNITFRRDLAAAVKDLKNAAKDFDVLAKKESPVADAIAIAQGLNKGSFKASSVITATRILRDEASTAFRNGQGKVGQAYRDMSKALEDAAEAHLTRFGDPAAVQAFRDARTQIAKTFSIEKALDGDGIVSAPKLANQLAKGEPLSGGLLTAAKFAEQFPKMSRVIKEAPAKLGFFPAVGGTAALGASVANPYFAIPAAISLGAPAIRAGLLSKVGQRALANPRGQPVNLSQINTGLLGSGILSDPEE